jgi:hypothetical protein
VEDVKTAADRGESLTALIRSCAAAWDPQSEVRANARPDGKLDVTVISGRFEGLDSRSREAEFWPALEPVPKSEMIYLTYCLLLTPQEAEHDFGSAQTEADRAENWDE